MEGAAGQGAAQQEVTTGELMADSIDQLTDRPEKSDTAGAVHVQAQVCARPPSLKVPRTPTHSRVSRFFSK